MVQDVKKKNEVAEAGKRLQEISEIKFGELSDDDILQLLAERKRFAEMKQKYEQLQKEEDDRLRKEQEQLKKEEEDRQRKAEEERLRKEKEKEEKERLQKEQKKQKEEEKRLALEQERAEIAKKRETLSKKKQALVKEIEELNQAISPAKADDDLLILIAQRKKLEKELREVEARLSNEPSTDILQTVSVEVAVKTEEKMGRKGEMGEEQEKEKKIEEGEMEKTEPTPSFRESLKKEFGDEEIGEDFPEGGELHRYLSQLKNNTGSLGTLLQEMPADAKKNKAFMLQVAEIDPAYAMHYADNELKKNEDFNVRAASLKNPRNSGNALAEMLPEARTSRVILAAVKQDYRNVKFIQPNMEDYDEIMRIAKKATLEKLQSLKSAADMLLIIPRPLQQDRQFMIEAKNIMSGENQKSA